MSIITKVKNMSAKKTDERAQVGTVSNRGYDTYKVINGLGLTVGLALLGSILTVMISLNKTITTERIVIGKHEIRLDNHDNEFDRHNGRLVRVEDKITEFDTRLGEHAIKDALYQNPFKGAGE